MGVVPLALALAGCGDDATDDGGVDPTSDAQGTSASGDTDPTGGGTATGEPTSTTGDTDTPEGSGSSSGDGSSSAETAATIPAAPSDLSVADLGGAGHLTWVDNSDNEDEFIIMRALDDGDPEELARTPFDSPTYHDEPLATGTYTWVVYATNAAGMSEPSNEATLTVP